MMRSFPFQENYDESASHNDMREFATMDTLSRARIDEQMFSNDANWDKERSFMYQGTHFTKKCRHFLGINWCYCKSPNMLLPIPCFGESASKKNSNKLGKSAHKVDEEDEARQVEYNHFAQPGTD